MSSEATSWVITQNPGRMADKMVLLGYANGASPTGRAFSSIAYLCAFGSMDAKTVNAAIKRLVASGYLIASGDKVGRTGQIPVYQMAMDRPAESERRRNTNTTKNGNVTENGNLTYFSVKAPQKRVTETPMETSTHSEATPLRVNAREAIPPAVVRWNDHAKQANWPIVAKPNDTRSTLLRNRLREHTAEGWEAALQRARASPYLAGADPPSWFTFDWLLKPTNFLKLIEGNYDRRMGGDRREAPRQSGKPELNALGAAALRLVE